MDTLKESGEKIRPAVLTLPVLDLDKLLAKKLKFIQGGHDVLGWPDGKVNLLVFYPLNMLYYLLNSSVLLLGGKVLQSNSTRRRELFYIK